MRIGINLLFLIPGKVGGTETYSRELINSYKDGPAENTYHIFVNRESINWPIPESPEFIKVVCPINAVSRLNRYLYEQFFFPFFLKKFNLDILHSLGYVGPVFCMIRHLVTIHDVNFVGHGSKMPFLKKIFLGGFVKAVARSAVHILTVSEFSKKEIINHLLIKENKVSVIYEASFIPDSDLSEKSITKVLTKFNLPDQYIIAFSSFNAHKNIEALINAFDLVYNKTRIKMILVGNVHNSLNLIKQIEALGLEEAIILTGYVTNFEIIAILKQAKCFVFPSLYEGFGLPVLEAQSVGTSVICSNCGSLPEIGLDSVEYFDPYSIQSMANCIDDLLNHPTRIAELEKLGFENLKRFSWKKSGAETIALYHTLIE